MEKRWKGNEIERMSKQANDEIDMSQDHPAAAVPRETKVIKCIPVVLLQTKQKKKCE